MNRLVAYGPDLDRATLAQRSLALAGALQARGVRRVGLWFDDAAQLAVALLACWRIGATAVLAPDNRAATRLALARLDAGLDLWLTDDEGAVALAMAGAPAAAVPAAGAVSEADRGLAVHAIGPLMAGAAPLSGGPLDLDVGAVVLCTSGSSGQPKQISKRWRQLAAEIEALEALWHWSETPACVLGSVSAQHMYGLPFRLLWPLCSGRVVARRQLVYPEALQHASLPHADFVWIASPALLKRLGTSLDHAALRAGLRQIVSSGGPLPVDVSDMLARDLACRPCEIYGSSETGAVAWRQGDTAWQPLPGAEVGARDHAETAETGGKGGATDTAAVGTTGNVAAHSGGTASPAALWIRSPWLQAGETFQSNDAVRLTAHGFVLLGRMDRIVKIEEKRIALPAVEQALATHPCVHEARVDLVTGEARLSALIALTPQGVHTLRNGGRAALAQALRTHIAPTQEALAVPRHWRFVRELPWNAQGKLPRGDFEAALQRPRWPQEIEADRAESGAGVNKPGPSQDQAAPASAAMHAAPATDGSIQLRNYALDVPLDLRQFDGHFAATPVVPGVAQIDWAMNLARRDLSAELRFHGADALKFQRLMRPGDRVALALRWEPARGRLYFEFRAGDQACSSGRILTQARHDAA
ncbi:MULTISPECIES: AMP-binding protein [unclassified Achromobacter]|uniref:AMP-binding protein n=1 Tax=unclassified Achromobacter TaxID=2626865 RepID=UPI001E3D0C5E|nr:MULTISPECIES: AMP-binding protein [unclassified Achromobacter]